MNELPASWALARLGDICRVVGGSTPRTSEPENWNGEVPWVTPDDLSRDRSKTVMGGARYITRRGYDSCSTQMVPKGTVLYTSRAPIGYAAIAGREMCTNQGFKSFVPPDGVLSDYLYWFLVHATPEIRTMGSGTTFMEISKRVAESVTMPLAPTSEQGRIVAAIEEQFSRIDVGVASLKRARRNLKRMRAAVLQTAVTGRLEPPTTNGQTVTVLLDRLNHERREATRRRSPLGAGPRSRARTELPETWAWIELGELLSAIEAGKSFKREQRPASNDEWGVISVSAMSWGHFDPNENKAVPSDRAVNVAHEIREGDLLLSRANARAHVGATVLVQKTRPRLLLSDKSLRLVPLPSMSKRWLHLALTSPIVRDPLMEAASGVKSGMLNVSQEKLRRLLIPVAPVPDQEAVLESVDRWMSVLQAQEAELGDSARRAERLRRSLLSAAFAGRLVAQDASDEPASVLLDRVAKPSSSTGDSSSQPAVAIERRNRR